jgi:HSP20 family molecular chaperone IbpA
MESSGRSASGVDAAVATAEVTLAAALETLRIATDSIGASTTTKAAAALASDAAQDRKVAFAKLISLEKMVGRLDERMGRLEERMGRLEERMGRQDENIRRLLERLDVAAEPAHSFADGEGGVLVLQVKLPGLSSISEVALDVSADGFDLSSPSFALRLAWPRAVDANGAKAKFLRKSGVLQVTLPGAGTSSEPR